MARRRTALVCGQLCEAPIGDYYVTCSFDSNHVILRSRMPYHIIKCLKNHPGHNKVQCPFDATEFIDPNEFPSHIETCESRRSMFEDKFETARLKASGSICNIQQTPFFHEGAPEPDEDWGGPPVTESVSNTKQTPFLDEVVPNQDKDSNSPPDADDMDYPVLVGVGRGISLKISKAPKKKGMGRAEFLKSVLLRYGEKPLSTNNDSLRSSDEKDYLRKDVAVDQFKDA